MFIGLTIKDCESPNLLRAMDELKTVDLPTVRL